MVTDKTIAAKFKYGVSLMFGLTVEQMNRDVRFKEDLNATSLQYMGMISVITDLTGQEISYAKMRKYKTMGDAIDLLESLANCNKSES